jgi:hypothetical protein
MGFKANKIIEGEILREKVDIESLPSLSQDEIMFLINYIGDSNFKGRDVEKIYQIVLKLQTLYLYSEQTKK